MYVCMYVWMDVNYDIEQWNTTEQIERICRYLFMSILARRQNFWIAGSPFNKPSNKVMFSARGSKKRRIVGGE